MADAQGVRQRAGGRTVLVAIGACAGAVLGGCGGPAGAGGGGTTAGVTPASARTYACWGTPVPADVLTAGRGVDELAVEVRTALTQAGVTEDGPWTVVATEPEMVLLLELPEPDPGPGPGATHTVIRLSPSADGTMDEPLPGQPWQWRLSGSSPCEPRLTSGIPQVSGLVWADLSLDPARLPDPASRTVTVLARFSPCTTEDDVTGPWRVVHLAEGPETIEVVIGADPAPPPEGPVEAMCRTTDSVVPVDIELTAPLAGRTLVDPTVLPAWPVVPPG